MHEKYGGIVPEVAAREQLKCIIPVITEALSGSGLEKRKGKTPLDTIDAIAVTIGTRLNRKFVSWCRNCKNPCLCHRQTHHPRQSCTCPYVCELC